MKRRCQPVQPIVLCLGALAIALQLASGQRADSAEPAKPRGAKVAAAVSYEAHIAPLLTKYCQECHGPKKQEAKLGFHKYADEASLVRDAKVWEGVLEMVEFGAMPPEDKPQPTADERLLLVEWLKGKLFQIDCELVNDPGRVTIRRLNKVEYNNTIRDLLGIDIEPAKDFPSDDVGEGFDNIGDVLSLPPLLFEKYMTAAERIADETIYINSPQRAPRQAHERLNSEGSARRSERRIYEMASTGAVWNEFDFRRDGQYLLRVQAGATQAGDEPAKMRVELDGKELKVFEVTASHQAMRYYEIELTVDAGKRRLRAAFINDFYDPKAKDPKRRDRNLYVGPMEVVGPLDVRDDELPASHRKLVTARPNDKRSVRQAAQHCLQPLVERAFRRPADKAEVERYARLVEAVVNEGESFERGLQVALTGVLVSPHFLFRVEQDPDPNNPRQAHELGQFELATRLSYFLWSTMPDDELFTLARQGKLADDGVLRQQVVRMIKDPKSQALVENFGGQWLNLRILDELSTNEAFPTFNRRMRYDMRRETELFFAAILREDRSILDFIDGNFTFVNERLAEHYGLKQIEGEEFRRIEWGDQPRRGVLTQASILALTSNPTRTSPVKRGKWIMENILGTPPPEPPANVPELDTVQKAAPNATLREQMVLHRTDPNCATCHRQMDPLGFGFENFDAIGRWRDKEGKLPIDASGVLPSGETFQGPTDLVKLLKQRKADFSRSLSSKMMIYALGRGLQPFDQCAIDEIVKNLDRDDRFSNLVWEIVRSEPFRKRRGEGGAE
jgi:mono/diheme cytochrome c family protein/PAS domain-containing protein